MVNASEGVMRRRQADLAYAGYLSARQEAGPKGKGPLAWLANRSQAAPETRSGVKHQPKANTFQITRRQVPGTYQPGFEKLQSGS